MSTLSPSPPSRKQKSLPAEDENHNGGRPKLLRGKSSALNLRDSMFKNEATQNRLRSRSLVSGTPVQQSSSANASAASTSKQQRPTIGSSYSAASVAPASPSIRVTYHEQDYSSTTDESTPPQTPVDREDLPVAARTAFRPNNIDIKGKRKAVEWQTQQEMYSPSSGNSWVSIPVAPTPKQENSHFAFEANTTPPTKVPRLGQRRQTLDSLDSPLRSATSAASDLHSPLGTQPGIYSMAGPIGILFVIFAASTCIVIFAISTLNLALPKSLSQVLEQATALKAYSRTSNAASIHILGVLGIMFIWKQAFSSMLCHVADYSTCANDLRSTGLFIDQRPLRLTLRRLLRNDHQLFRNRSRITSLLLHVIEVRTASTLPHATTFRNASKEY